MMKETSNTITNLKNTFLQNLIIILIIFFVLLILTIFISVFNISFKEKALVKDKAYILEGFGEKNMSLRERAKRNYIKESCKKNEKICSTNEDKKRCGDFHCCAWVNYKKGAKCVPGSARGPETKKYSKNGKIDYDHYYYKNKKYIDGKLIL